MNQQFPGFWRFAWLFFMQPVTLHLMLKRWGVEPSESGLSLWKRRTQLSIAERWWVGALAQLYFAGAPWVVFASALMMSALGIHIFVGAAGGVVSGVFGAFVGFSVSLALGVMVGLFMGVYFGVIFGLAPELLSGLPSGPIPGMAIVVVRIVASSLVASWMFGGVVTGMGSGVAFGWVDHRPWSVVGVAVNCGYLITRAPVYLLETGFSLVAELAGRLAWCPVRFHNLSYLPHPFLLRTILKNAEKDPALTREVLDACSIAPGQRRIGRRAAVELQAREVTRLLRDGQLADLVELNGMWLPGRAGARPLLLAIGEAAQYLAAGRAARNPHHRAVHLERLLDRVRAIQNQLRQQSDDFTRPFLAPITELEAIATEELKQAKAQAATVVLNPFRAGDPLSPEEGPELFVGREQAIHDIEALLTDSSRSASLALLAPRRCGKTSLLKMLPAKLPDAVCVFFDLQANPVASPASFFQRLAEHTILAAQRDRRLKIPPLPQGPAVESGSRWLDQLEETAARERLRILIAIDEFERLEELYPGNHQEFLQLMGLLRATIQHKRSVRLLVSGAAPFDELSAVWDDHFINTQQVRLGFLDEPTTTQLLCHPVPEFPQDLIPQEVAACIYQRTHGQPYLVQMYGSKLVDRVSKLGHKSAVIDDVSAIEPLIFEAADSFFRNSYTKAPEDIQPLLAKLARGEALNGGTSAKIKRWLDRRYLLDNSGHLAIPSFGTWIEQYAE